MNHLNSVLFFSVLLYSDNHAEKKIYLYSVCVCAYYKKNLPIYIKYLLTDCKSQSKSFLSNKIHRSEFSCKKRYFCNLLSKTVKINSKWKCIECRNHFLDFSLLCYLIILWFFSIMTRISLLRGESIQ